MRVARGDERHLRENVGHHAADHPAYNQRAHGARIAAAVVLFVDVVPRDVQGEVLRLFRQQQLLTVWEGG